MSEIFSQIFTLMTWNLFKKKGVSVVDWPGDRQEGMALTIKSLLPDILCTQETAPEYLDTILSVCSDYKCILPAESVVKANCAQTGDVRENPFVPIHFRNGNKRFVEKLDSGMGETDDKINVSRTLASLVSVANESGWLDEGNIIWRSDKFAYVEHGAVDIGLESAEARRPKRRLFWVRLRPRVHQSTSGRPGVSLTDKCPIATILVATAHLTWEGGAGTEQVSPFTNHRSAQALAALTALKSLAINEGEPIVFSGDMNDSWHVPFIMQKNGFESSDFLLNLPSEITHPAKPFFHEERIPSQTRDWIFSKNLKPVLTRACSNMTLGLGTHVSDHFPVMTVFTL